MFTGGVLGVLFIGTAAVVVPRIGALLLALSLIAGQTVGAVVLDTTGVLAPAAQTPTLRTWIVKKYILLSLLLNCLAQLKITGNRFICLAENLMSCR
jgi:uncharacterized membrane protein YdcZ (DUF606 family)